MTLLQERLFTMQDKQYAVFQAKLTPGVPMDSFIGIRVPMLRKFAKELMKEAECEEFLHQLPTNTTMRTCFTDSSFPRLRTTKNVSS